MSTYERLKEIRLHADGHEYQFQLDNGGWTCKPDDASFFRLAGPEKALVLHVTALRERVAEWKKAIEGLTPSGSEFVDAPKFCADYIRKSRQNHLETIKARVLKNRILQKRVKVLEKERDTLDTQARIMRCCLGDMLEFVRNPIVVDMELIEALREFLRDALERGTLLPTPERALSTGPEEEKEP